MVNLYRLHVNSRRLLICYAIRLAERRSERRQSLIAMEYWVAQTLIRLLLSYRVAERFLQHLVGDEISSDRGIKCIRS